MTTSSRPSFCFETCAVLNHGRRRGRKILSARCAGCERVVCRRNPRPTLSDPEVLAMLRTLVAVTAALLVTPATAAAATFPVGHTVKRMTVPGTLPQETREVDVHLWYPAEAAAFAT